MALSYADVTVEHREVVLRNKPQAMLEIAAKGTVPVLALPDGRVLDESLDIMYWALAQKDKQHWLDRRQLSKMQKLIARNDGKFKYYLDRYKYADRYPEYSRVYYRQQSEYFLATLENCLTASPYLVAQTARLADVAIMPFIRQFAQVDRSWFAESPYQALNRWLNHWLQSELFLSVMQKYPPWIPD